jgi:hypothetical protein
MGVPHLCIVQRHGCGATMCHDAVLVHCPSCLGAAATVLAAKIPRGDEVFTKSALERAKAVHPLDGVMSHSFNCRRSSLV